VGNHGAAERPGADRETVVFRIGDASYGIGIEKVRQVVKMREITPCAREGSNLCGVVNIKGRTVPVYDLCAVLDTHRARQTQKSRIIVTEGEEGVAAFVVDAVTHVLSDQSAIVDIGSALKNLNS
jgi:purine-binding chemotaxis protein CheW